MNSDRQVSLILTKFVDTFELGLNTFLDGKNNCTHSYLFLLIEIKIEFNDGFKLSQANSR